MSGILPMLIIVPLIGGVILLVADKQAASSKRAALVLAAVNLLLSVALIGSIFVREQVSGPAVTTSGAAVSTVDPIMSYSPEWLSVQFSNDLKFQMSLGADGLAAGMVFLTALVAFGVIAFAQTSIQCQFSSYAGWVLLSQAGLLVVFVSMDILLFYLGFELALLPLLALISGWGDEDRASVAKRFVLYTLAGSIPMVLALVGIVNLYSSGGQTILLEQLSQRASLATSAESLQSQAWIFWLLVLGLGIKVAILPFHTWMPSTYRASAPTTTALLAAVVLKLGFFGFFRLALPLVPAAVQAYAPTLLGTLGAIAIVYGAVAALAQTDLRLILAYSSLSHAGFISLGMFSLSTEGLTGAALQMFNHGITTAGMFLLVAAIVARVGSAEVRGLENGLASYFPLLGLLFMFFTFAGAGMPGLNNFVGELLTLSGMMGKNPVLALIGVSGVILGAWYALRLARKVMFGADEADKKHKRPHLSADLDAPQIASLSALAILCIAIGCLPQIAVNFVQKDVAKIAAIYQPATTSEASAAAVSSIETNEANVQIVANR
ncbi:MAG: NADH-quinone oxidoreductase subunit M [Pirellulales bacterium]